MRHIYACEVLNTKNPVHFCTGPFREILRSEILELVGQTNFSGLATK